MLVAAFTWGDLWRLALAVFLLAVGLAAAYLLTRLGGTAGRLSAFISGAEREILLVINKVGGSVDRVNSQLDKVDRMTDSAVGAVESVDTAVRTVMTDVTMDALEDLQVALDALLARRDDEGDVVVRVVFDDQVMRATLGPLPSAILEDIERDGNELGLRRVLETVCETFELEERNGEAW